MLRGAGGEPTAGPGSGTGGASILGRAAGLRFPNLDGLSGRERIDALIEHINATAIARGELEELRLEAHANLLDYRSKAERLWPGQRFKTVAARDDARRMADPALAENIAGATWLVARCTEQINRLGGSDYDAASRIYTMLS